MTQDKTELVPCPACDATGVQGHTTRYWCTLCDGDTRVEARIAETYKRWYSPTAGTSGQ